MNERSDPSTASYNIVFAGTPTFALPSLQACLDSHHNVCAVFTQPDKKSGRGQQRTPSPVKTLALSYDVPVHTPPHFKEHDSVAMMAQYQPDILVVVAYGMILPKSVLAIPQVECLNVHASLLPRWRGAAPINHAILAGDAETGVSIMRVVPALDAGPVYTMATCTIDDVATTESLYTQLAHLGADALLDVLNHALPAKRIPVEQSEEGITYAGKIQKTDGLIHWSTPADILMRLMRAMQPWPGMFFMHSGELIKVHACHLCPSHARVPAGIIVSWDKQGLVISTATEHLCITRLQLPGKRAMSVSEVWSGNQTRFVVGENLKKT